MYKPDFAKIARHIARDNCRIRLGETVLIRTRADAQSYAELIGTEAARAGGHPLIIAANDEFRLRLENESPPEVAEQAPPHLLQLYDHADVIITIDSNWRNPLLNRQLLPDRAGLVQKRTQRLNEVIYHSGRRRVIVTDYPTVEQAKFYGIDFAKYHLLFWRAVEVPPAEIRERARKVYGSIAGKSEIRVTSPKGTDLRFSLAGRKILVDDGILGYPGKDDGPLIANVPAGEVYCPPVESSVNGDVVVDRTFVNGVEVVDLVANFRDGTATLVKARKGFDEFQEFIHAGQGDTLKLGEFGIGLNPAVVEAYGSTLTDEKMTGTIHLALGDNRFIGGKNECSFHKDMLVFEPTVIADGAVIIDAGTWVEA